MENPKPVIIFIKPHDGPFFRADEKILEEKYIVRKFVVKPDRDKRNFVIRLINLTVFLLKNGWSSKIMVVWFADYAATLMVLAGKIFRRPTVIFAGGQEAICYKELGKGVYLKKFRGSCVRFALRNATYILPNHKSLIYHENYFYNSENPHIDGIQHYVPNLRSTIKVVPNGIDPSRVSYDESIQKQSNLILTVANVYQKSDFINKGFDLFIEAARRNPDLNFVIVTIKQNFINWVEQTYKISEIQNLKVFIGFCPDEVLIGYYNKAKVYVQISITEGMPVSLSEAMLCECIPVGSNVNGIPDAIGPYGVIINHRDVTELEQAIRKALQMDTGKKAREFTIQNYSIDVRKKILLNILQNIKKP